jgi:hypothetical protein
MNFLPRENSYAGSQGFVADLTETPSEVRDPDIARLYRSLSKTLARHGFNYI